MKDAKFLKINVPFLRNNLTDEERFAIAKSIGIGMIVFYLMVCINVLVIDKEFSHLIKEGAWAGNLKILFLYFEKSWTISFVIAMLCSISWYILPLDDLSKWISRKIDF